MSTLRQRLPGQRWRTIGFHADRQPCYKDDDLDMPGFLSWMQQSVLPRGYPGSVTDGYSSYARWTALSLVSGRIQSVLATQAALFAIGLGKGAIPMAAAVQWILKDGVGHACAILYAAVVSTRFDADPKRYRFQATIAMTFADIVSIAMPLCPQHFLLLASLSSATSSMAGLAQLAARARIQASFARQGNLADVARAGQTQAKLMSLFGTGIGAVLSWFVGANPLHVFGCMIPLAAISIYSTYRSSKFVVLQTLNLQRSERVFALLIQQISAKGWYPLMDSERKVHAPSPRDIAEVETFCVGDTVIFKRELLLQPLVGGAPSGITGHLSRFYRHVEVGAVLPLLGDSFPRGPDAWTSAWHANGMYALAVRAKSDMRSGTSPVIVWHRFGAPPVAKLQAVWHACVLRHFLEGDLDATVENLHKCAHDWWPTVLLALEDKGWSVERVFLDGFGASLSQGTDQ